jgi:excisionase family DNA binding protein
MTRLLTADEVAERLGVTKDWVWAQARAGRIPHVQLGRYRRFREEALEDWLVELEGRSAARSHGGTSRQAVSRSVGELRADGDAVTPARVGQTARPSAAESS